MFKFSDQHIEEYQTLGYTVFRNAIPPKLIDELRIECDKGAEIVRNRDGANAQRFQPISAFAIDQKPFEEYQNLPEIHDAVSRVLGMPWEPSDLDILGVLLEPAQDPWCMAWHRDWRDNVVGLDIHFWEAEYQNVALFNQVNCALYEDSCTWVVPGSHLRRDTQAEAARFPDRPIQGPDLDGLSAAKRERVSLDYCESLPNAQRLLLDAGDYCLYRNTLWHLGNYIPYRKRATLHDGIMTNAFREWRIEASKGVEERTAKGIFFENPNQPLVAA